MGNDRYLVILARNDDNDIYLLTTEQWVSFTILSDQGIDVCSAVSHTVEDDETGTFKAVGPKPPYFSTLGACFEYVSTQGLVLKGGDAGIGY